jgi:hypothetical protein
MALLIFPVTIVTTSCIIFCAIAIILRCCCSIIVAEAFMGVTTHTVVPPVNFNFHYKYRYQHYCHTDNRDRLITMALSASASTNNNNTDTDSNDPVEEDKNNNNDSISINPQQQRQKSKGYRFGDLTRGALKKVKGDVDLTRSAVKKIKGDGDGGTKSDTINTDINTLTSGTKNKSSYKFGDISKWLDKKAKNDIGKFTNKQEGDAYQFGDISKELIRRLRDGEYTRDDLLLFIKIVATIGINLTPVARILPIKVLTELLNLSLEATIAQSIGDKIISSLTNEIDSRMKEFVTGNREYQLGDYTNNVISKWTGKDKYEFGDLTKIIFQKRKARKQQQQQQKQVDEGDEDEDVKVINDDNSLQFSSSSKSDQDLFDEWDKKLLESRRQEREQEEEVVE